MGVFVVGASALMDLTRRGLLETLFERRFELAAPDTLYEDDLIDFGDHDRAALLRLGLLRVPLDEQGLAQALRYQRACPKLTIHDCFALAVASCRSWRLLTPDPDLTALAEKDGVKVHDVLWIEARLAEPRVTGKLALLHLRPAVPEVSRASPLARKTRRVTAGCRADPTLNLFGADAAAPSVPPTTRSPSRR